MAKKTKSKNFQAPKGTYDTLPEDQIWWDKINKIVKDIMRFYDFGRINTPILEDVELYVRGTGQTTDIVEKQMYTLRTKGGDALALRPEFTPGTIRAYLENGLSSLPQPIKLYAAGPLFRYERPQTGRFRQFHQFNFEIIGSHAPVSDAEIIHLFFIIFQELNLKNINLQINSIGCSECRPAYRKLLLNYYRSKVNNLCSDCKRRFKQNPLRLLDCKEEKCVEVVSGAPQIIDRLCEECHNHFRIILEFLDELEIPYILNPHLVRGLDYYSKTVFEFWPEGEERRQDTIGAGGRYDYLVKALGGKDCPAVGGACGYERLIAQMKEQNIKVSTPATPRVFLIQLGEMAKRKSLKLFEGLRKANIPVAQSFSKDSIKTQLRLADKAGVEITLIYGQQEVIDGTIIFRDMQTGVQETVKAEKLVKELKKRLTRK